MLVLLRGMLFQHNVAGGFEDIGGNLAIAVVGVADVFEISGAQARSRTLVCLSPRGAIWRGMLFHVVVQRALGSGEIQLSLKSIVGVAWILTFACR